MTNTGTITTPGPSPRAVPTCPRFLCVDDNDFVRDSLCALLLHKGWGCQSANSGQAGLQWLADCREPIDVLITDHEMPEMNGLEFIRKVRAANFTGRILVWSATVNQSEEAAYRALNVDAIILKSGRTDSLLQAIAGFFLP
jgi:two-component system chemotaxis response regulator CheY